MKKATFAALTGLIVLASAGTAHAQNSRLYVSGYMGLNIPTEHEFGESTTTRSGDIETDNTFSFAGALGLRLSPTWRIEAEVSYRNNDIDRVDFQTAGGGSQKLGGEHSTTLYMANIYYDFDFEWQNLYPFLSAGIGLAWHNVDIEDSTGLLLDASDSSIGFAWQLGSGLKYRLSENTALTGGYQYIGTSDLEIDTYDLDYSSHELRIGLEYDIPVSAFR